MNKSELVAIAKDYLTNTPYGIMDFRGREVIVLPTVFPPDLNTTYFCEAVEKVTSKFIEKNKQCRVFEMGMGAGAAIVSVAKMPGAIASASDISPMAVLNAKANALWWQVQCNIYQGDLFENVPQGEFDFICWNMPWFSVDPGGIEDVRFKIGFDPGYNNFQRFLVDVNSRLVEGGNVLLGVDHDMCDLDKIYHLIDTANFDSEVFQQHEITWGGLDLKLAFLLLSRK